MIFGMLNTEKIWHEHRLFTSPVRRSHFTVGKRKVIFNSIIHTCFWLFVLSKKKTNFNPLNHPTWKCHHADLWNATLFLPTEGLLRSFKCCWLWNKPAVMCDNCNARQVTLQQVFKMTTFCMDTCFQSFFHWSIAITFPLWLYTHTLFG